MCPLAKGNGVWPFNDAWLRTSLEEARRQAPRNGASILDAARELGIRDAQAPPSLHGVSSARFPRLGGTMRRSDSSSPIPPCLVAFAQEYHSSTCGFARSDARYLRPRPRAVGSEQETRCRLKLNASSTMRCSTSTARSAGHREEKALQFVISKRVRGAGRISEEAREARAVHSGHSPAYRWSDPVIRLVFGLETYITGDRS